MIGLSGFSRISLGFAAGFMMLSGTIAQAESPQEKRQALHDTRNWKECRATKSRQECRKRAGREVTAPRHDRKVVVRSRHEGQRRDRKHAYQPKKIHPTAPRYTVEKHYQRPGPVYRQWSGYGHGAPELEVMPPVHTKAYRVERHRETRCNIRYGSDRSLHAGDSLRKTLCVLGRDGYKESVHRRHRHRGEFYTMRYNFNRPTYFGHPSWNEPRIISTIWIVFDSNDQIVTFLSNPEEEWHHHHHHAHMDGHTHQHAGSRQVASHGSTVRIWIQW